MARASPSPFELDARSLALGRIALAGLLLVDLELRTRDLVAHYTDAGVLPRGAFRLAPWDFLWSFHTLGGSSGFEAALFAVQAAALLALLLGWRTRGATLLSAALLLSLHGRNPLLRDGQDDLSRVLLVWGCLLPWGARWSLDARAGRTRPLRSVRSPGTVGLLVQLVAVYWASGMAKLQSPWWTSGEGLSHVLGIGRYETTLGTWLRGFPSVLKPVTFAVIAVELCGPVLLFLHWRRTRWRLWAIALFAALHLGLALLLRLGLFPLVSLAGWSMLLPAGAWEWLERRRSAPLVSLAGWSMLLPAGAWEWLERRRVASAARSDAAPGAVGRGGAAERVLAAVGAALVLAFNVSYLWPRLGVPRAAIVAARAVGLQQYWSLFSPNPVTAFVMTDGWVAMAASQTSGREVNLLTGGAPVPTVRPALVADGFPDRRWRHWVANVLPEWPRGSDQRRTVEESRAAALRWGCDNWNGSHPEAERVESIRLVWFRQRLGRLEEPGRPEVLAQAVCRPR